MGRLSRHISKTRFSSVSLVLLLLVSCASTGSSSSEHQKNTPSGVRVIPMQNPAQPFELAAKLQWNPHEHAWDKVLVLYNGNDKPPANHPIWAYLSSLNIPQRSANKKGENLYYKAFHSYNYCTGRTALSDVKPLYINFNNDSLGSYRKTDFANDWNCPTWQMGKNLVTIVQGIKARSGKGLQLHFPKGKSGCNTGSCINWKPQLGGKFTRIRYSYWIKFPANFNFILGGKLPGIGSHKANTGGDKPSGYDGWSVRSMWNRQGQLGQYVYHMDQAKSYGEFMPWNMPPITRGQWHHIQTLVQLNTPKQANGIIRTWFDNKPVLNKTNIRFRMIEGLDIERFLFSSFFGGNGIKWAPTKDESLYIDDIMLSPS